MSRLLFWLTGRLPCRLINDGDRPYLERYFVARLFGVTVYLHRFVGSDPDRGVHDHPWAWALSLILAGWYNEETRAGTHAVRWINFLTGDSFHRVLLPQGQREVWTLFAHGGYVKGWGFLRLLPGYEDRGVLMFAPHQYRTNEAAGKDCWWHRAEQGRFAPRMPRRFLLEAGEAN